MRPPTDRQADFEAQVLTTAPGQALLAEVAATPHPGPAELARWRRSASPDLVSAAIRLADTRRRARIKFSQADAMWFEPTALEQATAEQVAQHKARRFGPGLVVDLCCGIGGDAIALAREGRVVAVDRDRGMCRRCLWNAEAVGVADRALSVECDAERFPIPPGARVHIDPDRRARGDRRAYHLQQYVPGLGFLYQLITTAPGGAIKLSPANDFEAHFDRPGVEVEVVSLSRECKEATVWFGELATCRRRATRVADGLTWTDRDAAAAPAPIETDAIERWLYSSDPALLRSGLLGGLVASLGLKLLNAPPGLVTGSHRVDSGWLAAFEVQAILPFDRKHLRQYMAQHRLGPLEIKVRGLDVRPEDLRRELQADGGAPATLFVLGGPVGARAVFARREAIVL